MPALTAAATVRVLSALWRHFRGGGDPECPSDTWEGPSKVLRPVARPPAPRVLLGKSRPSLGLSLPFVKRLGRSVRIGSQQFP